MTLPDELTLPALLRVIETLQQQLLTQQAEAAQAREEAGREIRRLITMIEGLTQQLDLLLRGRDEERRAELARLREEAQAAARTIGGDSDPQGAPEPSAPSPKPKPNRSKHGRGALPENLRRDTTIDRPTGCGSCGSSRLDAEKPLVTEELDYVRAHLRVRRTERTICRCRDCGARTVPELPPMPFDRASCTIALLAWLCYAKAGLFLPLDRLHHNFKAQGVKLSSSKLTR